MPPKQSNRVECAVTNHVAFMKKQSVHASFHPLMDFLKISPLSYALTASPTIYAEIVQEMWSTACIPEGHIKLKIKGKSYIITPFVINEALHLPNSNFQNLPTDEGLVSMLKYIKYASKCCDLSKISRIYLRKEWSYFFDTLSKVFSSRDGAYVHISKFVLKIAYSLMYGRTIDIGSLLLEKMSRKLGYRANRSKVISYARFLMIIANHLCKELRIRDRDYTLRVCVQTVSSFYYLVEKKLNAKVEFVLPHHIQAQLSTLSLSPSHTNTSPLHHTKEKRGTNTVPSTKVTLASQSLSRKEATTSVCGKRKNTALPTTSAGRSEENEEETEVNPSKKKMEESVVKPETRLLDVGPKMPPDLSRDGVLEAELPFSREEDIPQDQQHLVNQHLVNTSSVIKSQLVACLTSSADKLRSNDMIDLANRSYNALRAFGDDYTSFSREVDKLIAHRRVLEYAAKNKEKNDQDINARYIQKKMTLSDMANKFVVTREELSRAETNVEFLKLKREELTGALLKLSGEFSEEEKRVKNLAAERDHCQEGCSDVEAELRKLDAEKEGARVAFEAINDQYSAAKDEFERMNYQLLQLVTK